ncbi:hypothetical protein ACTHRK_15435 [Dietzia cercidiphylli]|uniref:hypothetical protein n=1 Tax=Dietzia cercidiphylli TaxID=498199 RepID=UPI003F800700
MSALRVQQVRRPVQRDDRLARPRAAVHHECARGVGADDRVLVGLDGGQHVVHPAGPHPAEARDERRLVVRGGAGAHLVVVVKNLVPVVDDAPARPPVPPPVRHAHRPGERRGEERLGGRRAPVHQQGGAGRVDQPDAAHVDRIGAPGEGDVPDAQVQPEGPQGGEFGDEAADVRIAVDGLGAGTGRVAATGAQAGRQVGDPLREAVRDRRELLFVGGDQGRIGLAPKVVGESENAGRQGWHRASVRPHRGLAARPPTSYILKGAQGTSARPEAPALAPQ